MSRILRDAAKLYTTRIGWNVFPVWGVVDGRCECGAGHVSPKDMGKHPLGGSGHLDAFTDQDLVDAHWPEGGTSSRNIGIPCALNGLLVVDVDPRNGGLESLEKLEAKIGVSLAGGLTALTGMWGTERGRHYYFRAAAGASYHGKLDGYPGIDIKHQGYVLAPPSMHGSGETYEWAVRGGPLSVPVGTMPPELAKMVVKGPARVAGSAADTYGKLSWKGREYDIDKIIAKGIPEGERIDTLYPIMCALANQYPVATGHGAASFRSTIRVLNKRGCRPPLPDDELDFQMKRAIDFVVENPKERMIERELGTDVVDWVATRRAELTATGATGATAAEATSAPAPVEPLVSGVPVSPPLAEADELLRIAADLGGGVAAAAASSSSGGSSGGGLPPDVDEVPIPEGRAFTQRSLSDMGNARRLADHYRGTIRYTEGMGWFVWDEDARFWHADFTGDLVLDKATALPALVARELLLYEPSSEQAKAITKWSADSRSTARLKSSMDQWKTRSWVRADVSAWDAHKDLLGVRNGVVNLKTGELLEGTASQGITRRTDVAYEKGMRAIQWEQFLDFATGGDKELQSWLQLAAGYTMTGHANLDVFFIVFGQPGSGKSTFLEAISHVLGDAYSISIPVSAVIDEGRGGGTDQYYWAQLPGKRMAIMSEWPQGKKTREDSIKGLTGDGKLTGRHPAGQPFTFSTQTKLWLGTNVTPAITDKAMWRRIRAIPFPHVPEKPNPDLKDWLVDPEGGLPAVMSWCVEGAVRYLNSSERDALGWCEAVRDASQEYRAHEDRMGQFLDEETLAEAGRGCPLPALYEIYKMWAEERGERPMTRLPFEKALAERGITVAGRGRHGVVEGVSLRPRTASDGIDGVSMGELRSIAAGWGSEH